MPEAISTVCSVIAHRAKTYLKDTRLISYIKDRDNNPGDALTELLTHWAEISDKPTVLLLDEIDSLVGDTGGSAFNIKATSLRLGNFTEAETQALWQQHTTATGQVFAPDIFAELWVDTRGQPWLINALGYELTRTTPHLRDPAVTITLEDYRVVREKLIQSRATHLDQLTDKLQEERGHRVIAAML